MIIWINGPYGVGKSTLAEELCGKLPMSFTFDAELVGDAVRENMPRQFYKETYEEFPLWHELCVRLLAELNRTYDGNIFVPMTLKRAGSYGAVIERLRASGVPAAVVMLDADPGTVHDRILRRGEEEDCWCMQQIPGCLEAQRDFPCDLRLDTTGRTVDALAEDVIRAFELR